MKNETVLKQDILLTRKDILAVSFIGICFVIFSIPILKNLNLPFIRIDISNILLYILCFLIFANIAIWIAAQIGKKISVIFQIAKFAAVGAFNTFLNWGVVNLLMAITQIFTGPMFILFNGIAFLAANTASYFWNKYWTFSSGSNDKATGNFLQFFAVTLIGLGVLELVSYVIVAYVTHPSVFTPARWANVGVALGTLLALVWNFIGYKFIVFKK